MKVIWTPQAEQDRWGVVDFIAAEDGEAAERLAARFDKSTDMIVQFPYAGRPGKIVGTRELIPHPDYRMVQSVGQDAIWIIAPLHTSRQSPPETL